MITIITLWLFLQIGVPVKILKSLHNAAGLDKKACMWLRNKTSRLIKKGGQYPPEWQMFFKIFFPVLRGSVWSGISTCFQVSGNAVLLKNFFTYFAVFAGNSAYIGRKAGCWLYHIVPNSYFILNVFIIFSPTVK
ncbi:MAG: hypothetical protein EA412_08260 [Chitinophagaceae bacterium]|nr:MAG: hypothetical protein EA412_08260 [Chitinophagaceae bacterium]